MLIHTHVDNMTIVLDSEKEESFAVVGLKRVSTMIDKEFLDMFVGVDGEVSGGGSEPFKYYLHQATFISKQSETSTSILIHSKPHCSPCTVTRRSTTDYALW